jgi:hypothetical protein
MTSAGVSDKCHVHQHVLNIRFVDVRSLPSIARWAKSLTRISKADQHFVQANDSELTLPEEK